MSCFLSSCRPKGILHSDEMREVLVDLHKTDAMLQTANLNTASKREVQNFYYAQVMRKHGITQAQFDSSLVWYTAHPQLFDKIYPKVLADLEAEEARFTALLEEEQQEAAKTASWTCHFDTTRYFKIVGGYYPELRTVPRDTLMHDSIDQLLPQIAVLR